MTTVAKPEKTEHRSDVDMRWASALRATAVFARKAASSEAEVLQAVIEELGILQLQGAVSLMGENGLLTVKAQSVSNKIRRTLQRLSGLDVQGYQFDPQTVDAYQQAISSKEAVFFTDRTQVIQQMMPDTQRGLLPRIMSLVGQHPVIVAPLLLENLPIGTINVSAPFLSPEDLPMVSALADHLAIALGHVQARVEMQAALNRERLRNQVAETIASALDLPRVLDQVIRLATEVTDAQAGAIGLLEPDGDTITYPHIVGLPDKLRLLPAMRGQGLTWELIESRTPMIITSYDQQPNALQAWVDAGVRGVLGVPLITGDEVIGGLGLFTTSNELTFDQEKVEMAQAIASMAAIAIKNARLYADTTQRAEESQALIRTAHSISASLDQDTVLHKIADEAKQLLRADASRIHLLDTQKGTLQCVVALGPAAEAAMALELEVGQGLVGHVAENGEPLVINNAAEDSRGLNIPGTPEDEPECLAFAPLSVRQRTLGTMTVRRIGLDRPFSASDLELLTAFAAQAAVTLENAHLFSQIATQAQRLEMEVAERTRELARSESHFRSLVETSLAGILQIDTEGNFVYVNQRFADMLELKPEDLIGKPVTSYQGFDPAEHQEFLDRFAARLKGEPQDQEIHEMNMFTQSGRRIPVLLAESLITDDEGNPQGVTGLVMDISRQKALEAALQAERDRLDALLTNIGDAVMVTDADGTIEYVNPGWERLNGYIQDEVLGKNPRIIQSGQHPAEFYVDMWSTILNGETWRGEVINCRKDGTYYDAALTIRPVLDDSARVINFVGLLHDISALKEIDRLKSQFVSDVSHELRTPLTNIRLYLDLLERKSEDREKAELYLETLSRESERLANLIDDLLSLSRLDADAVPFYPAPVDINELIHALVHDRSTLAAKLGLNLNTELEGSLPTIIGDDRLLSQVFTNLLTNAMSYTPEGGLITLRTNYYREKDAEWVVAEVEDTGLGIPADEIQMIFRRFFRGSASQSTKAPGTGLGLSICKEIVDRHNGQIRVESEGVPGMGSRFSVWLPIEGEIAEDDLLLTEA
jgi:PAS domain S-box-containing protein